MANPSPLFPLSFLTYLVLNFTKVKRKTLVFMLTGERENLLRKGIKSTLSTG